MKQVFFAVVIIVACAITANAQKGSKQIGTGVESGFTTGGFGDVAKIDFDVSGKRPL